MCRCPLALGDFLSKAPPSAPYSGPSLLVPTYPPNNVLPDSYLSSFIQNRYIQVNKVIANKPIANIAELEDGFRKLSIGGL